ncbi:hypothetical protein CRG98_017981 [Punica granatum]|uniref:Secreted protein n=1 Tax=Punica granatum TaxID=22663 RepID=A0A2I0K1M7_PUNGR|nr:hypothetical protein CRG98_017981 [Punica granatum]
MWTLVGARMCAFGSLGLGVSTFPWGRVTDTRERRSRHLSFYDPKALICAELERACTLGCKGMHVRGARCTGLGVREHARAWQGVKRPGSVQVACAGAGERASTGALFTREHVLHPE